MKRSNATRNISCRKCRYRHPANLSCQEAKLRAEKAAAKRRGVTEEVKVSDWDKLRELIAEYAESYVADSVKGGGDPADYAEIESRLKLDTERLDRHIEQMERTYREAATDR